jgi:hypothetical protein
MKKREIKFRIWDDRLKTMSYFDVFNTFGRIPDDCKDNLQQYTGMQDKKGVDVYEGDIVLEDHDGGTGEAELEPITFSYGCFHIGFCDPLYDNVYSNSPTTLDAYIVVGNIFENPELLKDYIP